jgi:hypothetical protein
VTELKPYVKNVKKQMHFRSIVMGVARSIMLFAYAVGMGYGAKLMTTANLDYGVVFKLKNFYYSRQYHLIYFYYRVSETVIVGSWSIGNAFSFSPNFQKGLIAADRIFALLRRVPEVKNALQPLYLHHKDVSNIV